MYWHNTRIVLPKFIMKWMCLVTVGCKETHKKIGKYDTFYLDNTNMLNIIITRCNSTNHLSVINLKQLSSIRWIDLCKKLVKYKLLK